MQLFPFRLKAPRLGALSDVGSTNPAARSRGRRGRRLPPARSPFWPALIGGSLLLLTFVVNYFVSLGAIRLTLVLV